MKRRRLEEREAFQRARGGPIKNEIIWQELPYEMRGRKKKKKTPGQAGACRLRPAALSSCWKTCPPSTHHHTHKHTHTGFQTKSWICADRQTHHLVAAYMCLFVCDIKHQAWSQFISKKSNAESQKIGGSGGPKNIQHNSFGPI